MSATAWGVTLLVSLGSLVCLLSALGLAALDDPADKLHYVGPLTTVAPITIALAIVLEDGLTSQAGLKALCVAAAVVVTSPIVSYATLRAIRTRNAGAPVAADDASLQT